MNKPIEPTDIAVASTNTSGALGRARVQPKADPASSYLARLSLSSRRTQGFAVKKVVELMGWDDPATFPWHEMTYQHAREFLLRLERSGLKFTTANRHIAALRGVLQEAWRMGIMTSDAYMRSVDPLKPVRGEVLPAGRMFAQDELVALHKAIASDESFYGCRDMAMFTLMSFGLRQHEVVGARLDDYERGDRVLSVVGKGNKQREISLTEDACRYLDAWIKVRPRSGAPFILTKENGDGLSPQAVTKTLVKRIGEASTDAAGSHDFRRTFGSTLLDAGVDIATVQKLMGHSDPKTTARYDRRGRSTRARAVENVLWGKKNTDSR